MTPRILAALTELADALAAADVDEHSTVFAHAKTVGEGAQEGSGVCCFDGTQPHCWLTQTRASVRGLNLVVIHSRPATDAEIVASTKPHGRNCPYHWAHRPEVANAESKDEGQGRRMGVGL